MRVRDTPGEFATRLHVFAGALLAASLLAMLPASSAHADGLDPALSRLRICSRPAADGSCPENDYVGDFDAWRSLASELAWGIAPSLAHAADGTGVRGFSLNFETTFSAISNDAAYWRDGTEGDSNVEGNRFVPSTLRFGRLALRKGLPFGLELGANIGHVFDSSLWTAGAEVQWNLFEGFSRGPLGVLPDFAVRGAVNTLVGEGELYMTVPSVDFIISKPFTIARRFDLVPIISAQLLWLFSDAEVTDLTPEIDSIGECVPRAGGPFEIDQPHLQCTGDAGDLDNNVLFPRMRSFRARISGGLLVRWRVVEVGATFAYDLVSPSSADDVIPESVPSQWAVTTTAGFRY